MQLLKNVNPARIKLIKEGALIKAPVIYWMQRDQRVNDNWALLYAEELALKYGVPLYVVFCLAPSFMNAALRHYSFMLKGLEKTETELKKYNIPFALISGEPNKKIPEFIKDISAGAIVTDFNPVKIVADWKKDIKDKIDIPFYEVDSHNIVPCRVASNKLEFAAYTIRPKIIRLLGEYLEEFPSLIKMKKQPERINNNWKELFNASSYDRSVKEINWLKPGEDEAVKTLQEFINVKFPDYALKRNDPASDALSNLSPYFHFGQ